MSSEDDFDNIIDNYDKYDNDDYEYEDKEDKEDRKPNIPPVILNTKEIFSNELKNDSFILKKPLNFKHKMILSDKCTDCLHNSFYSLDNESIVLIVEKINNSHTLFAINLQKNEKINISEDNDFSNKPVKGFDTFHYQDIQNHRDLIILSITEKYPSQNNYIYIYDFKNRKKILTITNPILGFEVDI